jgi:hypothetical protein
MLPLSKLSKAQTMATAARSDLRMALTRAKSPFFAALTSRSKMILSPFRSFGDLVGPTEDEAEDGLAGVLRAIADILIG